MDRNAIRELLREMLLEMVATLDQQLPARSEVPSGLTSTERRLLGAANCLPIPGKVLIRRGGLEINSTTRNAITKLVRMGQLVRTADGYTRKHD